MDGASLLVKSTVVIALGGNAITKATQSGTYEEQRANALEMAKAIARLTRSGLRVVLTHGNGPQVGNLAIQQEKAESLVPAQPLFALGAMSQGQIGHILTAALRSVFKSPPVVALVTHVHVDERDRAFKSPTKPIGPFMTQRRARSLAEKHEWDIVEDSGRGWRRVVASPDPKSIVESGAIRTLVDDGYIVIAAGGGGIPVRSARGGLVGVNAVIDKDLSAERLATSIGAEILVLLTGVDRVALHFGTAHQQLLDEVTLEEAEAYVEEGHFPPGSMGPKMAASIRFLKNGGRCAIITSTARLEAALKGASGTRIVADRARAVGE